LERDAAIEEALRQALDGEKIELVDWRWVSRHSGPCITLFIHNMDGAVDFDALRRADRAATRVLEERVAERYRLDVSSPGMDRPLESDRDFERNIGRLVELRMAEESVSGHLDRVDGEAVYLILPKSGSSLRIERSRIERARVVPDWGGRTAPHPG
jgi:ribosome maturation factor RimP